MRRRNELALLPKSPLLITESADEFDALRDAFEREIKPRGIIERMYVHDICSIVWDRRCKAVIINAAFSSALEDLLVRLRPPGQQDFEAGDPARRLAHAWFTDKAAKKQVLEILGRFELDESAIEAEAIRRSSADLELLDRNCDVCETTGQARPRNRRRQRGCNHPRTRPRYRAGRA